MITIAPPKVYSVQDCTKEIAAILLLAGIAVFILYYPFPSKRASLGWIVIAFSTLIALVRLAIAKRTIEVIFDSKKKEIIISYKTLITPIKQHVLVYETAKLEYSKNEFKISALSPFKVYFLKNKMEVFEITTKKDNFTREGLTTILESAKKEGLTISEI